MPTSKFPGHLNSCLRLGTASSFQMVLDMTNITKGTQFELGTVDKGRCFSETRLRGLIIKSYERLLLQPHLRFSCWPVYTISSLIISVLSACHLWVASWVVKGKWLVTNYALWLFPCTLKPCNINLSFTASLKWRRKTDKCCSIF